MSGEPGLALAEIYRAQQRIAPFIERTPLRRSDWLSSLSGADISLKLESLQLTSSFKLRGALNAVLRLREETPEALIVTASAGNHGKAMAWAAARCHVSAMVFTPATAPATKKDAIRRLGATLRDDAPDYDAAERLARAYARDTGATYVSPYNHRDVIAGAGTIALEIIEAAPDVALVVVPLGGGGLASGVACALAQAAPAVTVVGVEVEASQPFAVGRARGAITAITVQPSLADGLVGNLEPASMTFALVQRYVPRLASVSEESVARAIRGLVGEEHVVAEGAGAVATAAVLAGGVIAPGARAVALVTGANIDLTTLARVLSA